MAITQAMCSSFKKETLEAVHDFTTDTFKIALYVSTATLDATTTVYAGTDEVANGSGYTTGGNTLAGASVTLSGTTAFVDFTDSSWAAASFTARGALIYNSSKANKAVAVLDFGADKTCTTGTFTVQMPAAAAATALIRYE